MGGGEGGHAASGSGHAGGRNMHRLRLLGGGFPVLREHRGVRPSQVSTEGP